MLALRLGQLFPDLFGRWAFRPLALIDDAVPCESADARELERIRDEERLAAARHKMQVTIGTLLC